MLACWHVAALCVVCASSCCVWVSVCDGPREMAYCKIPLRLDRKEAGGLEGDAVVLHRHVGKRDQSSFLLQAQLFPFATALSSRSSTALRLDWHSSLPSYLPALHLAVPWDCHVPNTHNAVKSVTSYLLPQPPACLQSPCRCQNLVPYPLPPITLPQANACTGQEGDVKMKLKQAASEAVRQPDCFNSLSVVC